MSEQEWDSLLGALVSDPDLNQFLGLHGVTPPQAPEVTGLRWPDGLVEKALVLASRLGTEEIGARHLLLTCLVLHPDQVSRYFRLEPAAVERLRLALRPAKSSRSPV